jgi:hypothetical protein
MIPATPNAESLERKVMTEPNFDRPVRPIAEFTARPDFPQSVLGELVDIGGYTGVVVEIVSNSIRVRSPEGATQRFNYHTLRRLYAPRVEAEPLTPSRIAPEAGIAERATVPSIASTERREIEEPNFDRKARPIRELAGRPDFPQCAYGELVEIGDYTGVVVAIVNQSLKVRSPQGTSRKYNADILRKLYGKG